MSFVLFLDDEVAGLEGVATRASDSAYDCSVATECSARTSC